MKRSAASPRNKFGVPKKMWNRWTESGREVFNLVYESMVTNQNVYIHPKSSIRPRDHWATTCWNAAWTAADAASDITRRQVIHIKLSIKDIAKDIDKLMKDVRRKRNADRSARA